MGILTEIRGGQIMVEIKKQLPFAISKALNDVSLEVVKGERKEMENVFDNPTPYALNSFYIKRATKTNLEAQIITRKSDEKGTAPVKFLGPEIFGNNRRARSSELQLREKGLMEDDQFWIKGKGARLDRYGNISPGQIVQILSALQAFKGKGAAMNYNEGKDAKGRTKKRRSKNPLATKIFALKEFGKNLLPGVYQRSTFGVKPLLMFVVSPHYSEHFKFYKVGEEIYGKEFERLLQLSINQALRTAK